ncbi:hypothetical protein DV736_g167, partial [Chaetothyriales sp. CBS 134916]
MASKSGPERSDFEIGILCALPLEARAVKAILKESSGDIDHDRGSGVAGKAPADKNVYTTGKIGHHDVVLALYAWNGGVPAEKPREIMLGDVIVSKQVIQYDFGRQYPDGFKRKDGPESSLGRQNPEIRAFVSKLESEREDLEKKTFEYLTACLKTPDSEKTIDLDALKDELFPPRYWHKHHDLEGCKTKKCSNDDEVCEDARNSSCGEVKCNPSELERLGKPKKKPNVHFGLIASGDKVMKSGEDRDRLAEKENVIAFDMEGAGKRAGITFNNWNSKIGVQADSVNMRDATFNIT